MISRFRPAPAGAGLPGLLSMVLLLPLGLLAGACSGGGGQAPPHDDPAAAPPAGLAPEPAAGGEVPAGLAEAFGNPPGTPAGAGGPGPRVAAEIEMPNTVDPEMIVARVNGREIRGDQYNRAHLSTWKQSLDAGVVLDPQEHLTQLIEAMVGSELLKQEALAQGIKADPAKIEEQFRAAQSQASSPDEFNTALKVARLTPDKLRRDITDRLIVEAYIEELARKHPEVVKVSDEEARAFYEANSKKLVRNEMMRAHHILRKLPPNPTEKQKKSERARIEEALERLKAGEEFEAVARSLSTDVTAVKGGDLGLFPKGVMVPPFEEALSKLQPGETSDIVETRHGYHIIRLDQRVPGGLSPFEDLVEPIKQILSNRKRQTAVNAEIERLRARAKVEVFLTKPTQAGTEEPEAPAG